MGSLIVAARSINMPWLLDLKIQSSMSHEFKTSQDLER